MGRERDDRQEIALIKVIALIGRKPGLTVDAFRREYRDRHAALCWSSVPEAVGAAIVHYVQNHSYDLGAGTDRAPFDCVTEIGFRDAEGLRLWNEWYLGPEGKEIRADEERFMDVPGRIVIVVEEADTAIPKGVRDRDRS